MKDFMESLFNSQYFVIILFSAIGILAILFIIVLIMALRDAKKNKKAHEITIEDDKAETMADVAFASVNDTPVKVEVNQSNEEENKTEDVVEIKATDNNSFEDIKVDAPTMMPEENVSQFTDLDISKPDIKVFDNDDLDKSNESVKEEPVLKPQQPEQFSSIYVTPGAIPEKEETSKESNDVPDFSDIPMPTPIQVVNSSSIIDSSKRESDSASTDDVTKSSEEYTLK